MSVRVELLDVRFARVVDRFVLTHPRGTPFHETRWMELVRSEFDFENHTLVAWREGEVAGVLPMAMVNAPITGRRLVSVPFGVYGGMLFSDEEAWGALDEAGRLLADRSGVRYLETRYLGASPTAHESLRIYETYRKELPSEPEGVLEMIPRKARAEVRKAREKHGLKFRGGADLFEDFHRLYVLNKRSLGSPLFARPYFRRLLDLYGPRASLHAIQQGNLTLCAVLSLRAGAVLYPYYSGAEEGIEALGANNALYASLMEEAVRSGCSLFDFGRSRIGSGPAAFKRHMGFLPTPLDYQFYFPRGGRLPSLTPSNPRTALPRWLLSTMPVWMARLVGPAIMRHVP